MKWRKTYQNWQEQKSDRQIGVITAVGLNALLLMIPSELPQWIEPADYPTAKLILQLLPWVVNIGFITLALIFRAEMAVGCLTAIGAILLTVFVLGIAFVIGCFAWMGVAAVIYLPLSLISDELGGALGNMAGFIVFLVVFLRLAASWVGAIWEQFRPFEPEVTRPSKEETNE